MKKGTRHVPLILVIIVSSVHADCSNVDCVASGLKKANTTCSKDKCTTAECCMNDIIFTTKAKQKPPDEAGLALEITIQVLVWITQFGLSASVDFAQFRKSFRSKGIIIGLLCQFFLLPLLGFAVVSMFSLKPLFSVILLIIVSSPGGSYSNWWCSLFNADLALSVAMTTVSSVFSCAMLPLNCFIYIQILYSQTLKKTESELDINDLIDFEIVGITLGSVISAIILGLLTGIRWPRHQEIINRIGNIAGFISLFIGVFVSSASDEPPWGQTWDVYVAVSLPLLIGIFASFVLCTLFKLPPPQRVAVAIETAFQNINIATAVSFSIPGGLSATVIPIIYGGYEVLFFGIFCIGCWKMDWTLAPSSEPFWKMFTQNYQNRIQAIPVSLNSPRSRSSSNKIFSEISIPHTKHQRPQLMRLSTDTANSPSPRGNSGVDSLHAITPPGTIKETSIIREEEEEENDKDNFIKKNPKLTHRTPVNASSH